MAELNFGLLTPPGSENIANAFVRGQDQAQAARLQDVQMQQSMRQGQMAELQFKKAQNAEAKLNQFYAHIAENGGPSNPLEIENKMIGSGIPQVANTGLAARMTRLALEQQRKRDYEAMFGERPPDVSSSTAAPMPLPNAGPTTAAPMPLVGGEPSQAIPMPLQGVGPTTAAPMPLVGGAQSNAFAPPATAPVNAMAPMAQPSVNNLDRERRARLKLLSENPGVVAAGRLELQQIMTPHTQTVDGQVVERQPDGTYRVVFGEKKQLPIIELQAILAKMPLNDPNRPALEAEFNKAKVAQDQGAQRNRISLGQLNLGQSKFAWEKANPGYELKQDENGGWVGVNKRTLQTTPVTAPTTAPSAPSAAEGAVPAGQFKGRNQATASQEGAAYNANRILTSAKQIQSAVNKNAESNAPGLSEAVSSAVGLEGVSNLLRGPQRQIVAGAQADIIDSLLFLATGAAYNKEQLAQQRASYLPAYTDKPEALAAKQERLLGLITAVKSKSGSRWTKEMDDAVSSLRVNAAVPPPTTAKTPAAGAGVTVRDW
jgi:hypothetical protein